ncbi:MAG: ribulose 1,5-bisphosphate carboxylase [Thermoprotei archaeon]|nr:MAG: ribulose 1,5-bisphosphate carboxylase [Thermoprotei archaeon]
MRLRETWESTILVDPDKYVIARYYVEPKEGIALDLAAEHIAAEQSTGTWTPVEKETPEVRKKYAAKVITVLKIPDLNAGIVDIAWPVDTFDPDTLGLTQLMVHIAGNLFGIGDLANVRLLDVYLPKEFVKSFKGPAFGVEGVRKFVGTEKSRRPHLGTIVKPDYGLPAKEHIDVVYNAAIGGVDFVKDDELLVNPPYSRIEERASLAAEALDRVKSETGRRVLYAINVTARPDKILELADRAIQHGANCIMIDFIWAGLDTLRMVAEDPSVRGKVVIHCHRAGHAAFTRNPKHGITMMVIAKLVRLAGGDQLHTGTAAGKMHGVITEIQRINLSLTKPWLHLKSTMPVASGGIHPGNLHWNVLLLGPDVVCNMGGGIHGHPRGTRAGAVAARAALEAILKGIDLREYAKQVPELKEALDLWGYKPIPRDLIPLIKYVPAKLEPFIE